MPANNRQAAPQSTASPTPRATARYTNKDGTKYISVPKPSASSPPAVASPTSTPVPPAGLAATSPTEAPGQPHVNRKKQKRRAKAAAKAAAEQAETGGSNSMPSPASASSVPRQAADAQRKVPTQPHHSNTSNESHHGPDEFADETESERDASHTHSPHRDSSQTNGAATKSKKSRKKKKKKDGNLQPESLLAHPGSSKDKIWNTSGPEERERIKQFWLGLGEDERKSLVKVEKDAVLKKMKEQQKQTCSCSVCGRKRTAIEEELEGLYDAYYEELESFANQPQHHPDGPPMFGAPKRFGPMTGLHPPGALPSRYTNHHPSRGRIVEHVDNDEDEEIDEDDELDEEEEDGDDYSDEDDLDDEEEDEPDEIPRDSYQNEFFTFGQSLTVKGGILTVADDLLKNDGKKFIEMMEQLAERRMAREEDARDHYSGGYGHAVNGGPLPPPHHPPPEEDDFEEEEEEGDEEYDSGEEEYDDEEDTMTEEQRMEEGRRMFQIFAARMFEQRVLTAYREKVSKERQNKLLEELEQEDARKAQQAAKKARDAQKKKDKAAQKKAAQLEEKQRKDALKAEEEASRKAEEERRADEAKRKAEEKRKKKDAQRKAEEEERHRKEADRQRRVHEQREKQAEQERRSREAKEREKKVKEERQRKEQEAREHKERETRERREKHEKDKREKELRAAQAKADRDAKEKQRQEEKANHKAAASAAPAPPPASTPASAQPSSKKQLPVSIPALPHHPAPHHASPQLPAASVATPILPKAPTPMKPRSASQEVSRSVSQASHPGSGPSQTESPQPMTPSYPSPGPIGPPRKASTTAQPSSPMHAGLKAPPGLSQPGSFPLPMAPMGIPFHPPPGITPPHMNPSLGRLQDPMMPMHGGFGMAPPPGLGPLNRQPYPMTQPPPGFSDISGIHQAFPASDGTTGLPGRGSHSRQASASYDAGALDGKGSTGPGQPISRPTPIGRPASIVQGQRPSVIAADIDDMSLHLGSSALLDDTDEPVSSTFDSTPFRRPNVAPGAPSAPSARPVYTPTAPFIEQAFGTSPLNSGWGAPHHTFSPPPGISNGWPSAYPPAFGVPRQGMRNTQPRTVTIRTWLVQSYKDLLGYSADANGYIELSRIKGHVDSLSPDAVPESELLAICETEGNAQNGGGNFDVQDLDSGKPRIRYLPDAPGSATFPRTVGAPGEIGSPIMSSNTRF